MIVKLFIVFAILLAICLPVSVTLGISGLIPKFVNASFPANAQFLVRQIVGGVDSTPILALPLFVLSGVIMARGEVSAKLFNVFAYFLGRRTGAMPCVVVLTCLFYGAISGSAPATTAAVGAMTIPLLVGLGYDKVFVTALVVTSGGLGVIVPPSIPFILYGLSSSESVGKLFIAGIVPGILIGVCLMAYAWYYCKSRGEGFGAEVQRRILIGTYVLSHGYYDAYYLQAQKLRRLIAGDFRRAFAECDLIAGPTSPVTAWTLGAMSGDPVQMYLADIYTTPVNLAGLPGLSHPCGFDAGGLPVGLQLIGGYFSEAKLLAAAHRFQQATDWHLRRPALAA